MAKYNVTYSCGHSDVIALFGPHKDREWKLEREAEKLCPDCYKAHLESERAKQNEEAAKTNEAAGLPALKGSEKQIAWAETIRAKIINRMEELPEEIEKWHDPTMLLNEYRLQPNDISSLTDYIALNHTSASWWIDRRDMYSVREFLLLFQDEKEEAGRQKAKEMTAPPAQIVADAQIEATIRPEKAVTETIAEISITDSKVKVHFPEKRDDFREAIKKLGFSWEGHWERTIRPTNGAPEDRAAEVGHLLLAQGFIIRIYDTVIRQKAIDSSYEKECTRWIMARTSGDYAGWFSISWNRQKEDYYNVARKLPGSKYNSPDIVVRPEHFEEVLDFANRYNFQLSNGARNLVESAKAAKEAVLVAKVDPPKKERKLIASDKPPVLEVPQEGDIDEALRDED